MMEWNGLEAGPCSPLRRIHWHAHTCKLLWSDEITSSETCDSPLQRGTWLPKSLPDHSPVGSVLYPTWLSQWICLSNLASQYCWARWCFVPWPMLSWPVWPANQPRGCTPPCSPLLPLLSKFKPYFSMTSHHCSGLHSCLWTSPVLTACNAQFSMKWYLGLQWFSLLILVTSSACFMISPQNGLGEEFARTKEHPGRK